MEKTKILKIAVAFSLVFFASCKTVAPLKESDNVYRLKNGVYESNEGQEFEVDDELPMWAIAEGKMYDVILDKPSFVKTHKNKFVFSSILFVILFLIDRCIFKRQ